MKTVILIMFIATSSSTQSGAGGITQEFNSLGSCLSAGHRLAEDATNRKTFVLTWGCFDK